MPAIPNNLPIQLSSFIGREAEIGEVTRMLARSRLVTLAGAGGCGKTRLALQVAAELLGAYPDGVWLVDLAPVTDPSAVVQRVAAALDAREQPGEPLLATVTARLQEQQSLLLLDNCEHLIESCAQTAAALLRACARLRILATSRETLRMDGELMYPIPSLQLPAGAPSAPLAELLKSDAVRLFVERAQFVRSDFTLSAGNAPSVIAICRQLEGIPLALELAAARVNVLATDQIAARLVDRFRLLTSSRRTVLPRHQSLLTAIDWSYDLLAEPERRALRRLALFVGGWTLEDAEEVCAGDAGPSPALAVSEVLDILHQLVGKSLVQHDHGRYRMLETIRLYALERLVDSGELEPMQARHFAAFARLAAQAEPQLKGPQQLAWLDRLEADHDNLRAALACRSAAVEHRLQLALNLAWFWNLHSHLSEGRRWLRDLLAQMDAESRAAAVDAVRTDGLMAAGMLAWVQDDYEAARAALEPAIRRFRERGDRRGLASALVYLGSASYWQRRVAEARAELEESAGLFRAIGDRWGLAFALHYLDMPAVDADDDVTVRKLNEESLALFRELGDRWAMTLPLGSLGVAARNAGNEQLAEKYLTESLAIQRQFADWHGVAWTLIVLGVIALHASDFARAEALCAESLVLYRQMGNRGIMTGVAILHLGNIALRKGAHASASERFAEALALFRAIDDPLHQADTLQSMGRLHLTLGDFQQACACYAQSLHIRSAAGLKRPIANSLRGFAYLALAVNQPETAAKLLGAAEAIAGDVSAALPPLERAEFDNAVKHVRTLLGPRFEPVWAEGRRLSLAQAAAAAEQMASAPDTPSVAPPANLNALTRREAEVLRCLSRGLSDKQIAAQLVISVRTVHGHLRSIYGKLNVTNRTAALHAALQQNIL